MVVITIVISAIYRWDNPILNGDWLDHWGYENQLFSGMILQVSIKLYFKEITKTSHRFVTGPMFPGISQIDPNRSKWSPISQLSHHFNWRMRATGDSCDIEAGIAIGFICQLWKLTPEWRRSGLYLPNWCHLLLIHTNPIPHSYYHIKHHLNMVQVQCGKSLQKTMVSFSGIIQY